MLIQGRNGRQYKDGKLVDPTPHPENRSRSELAAARAAASPKQEASIQTGNPFETTIALELRRHNHLWAASAEGTRVLGNLQRASADWEANEKAKQEKSEFVESVRPLLEHATAQYDLVLGDETASVFDCECAAAALESAKRGDRSAYVAWEKSRHEQVTAKLANEAADYDSQSRAAVEKRNAVLASALEPTAVPEIKPSAPTMGVPIDPSRGVIIHKIQTPNGVREEMEIVDTGS